MTHRLLQPSVSQGNSSGQALTEALVALLVLVPFWVAAFHLWVWQDLQHAAIAAARYALIDAFSDPAQIDAATLQERTRIRILATGAGRFSRATAGRSDVNRPRADWRGLDPGSPLLDSLDRMQVTVSAVPQPESAERAERAAFAMLSPALALGVGPFELRRAAARRSRVELVLDSPVLRGVGFDATRITLSESLYAMVDPWVSDSAAEVADRTRSLSAVGLISGATVALKPVKDAVELLEPSARYLCPGRIDPDIVPEDRLQGGNRSLDDLRLRPC